MICASGNNLMDFVGEARFATALVDPPWRFTNKSGKIAPEHKRLARYRTMSAEQIKALPVAELTTPTARFTYKSNLVWHKVRKDGGSDGRGVGFYFRNVTELILFGVKGKNARTLAPGRRQVNLLASRKREHSRKPDEQYAIIEACSPGPYLELFARGTRPGWTSWGHQADDSYVPTWKTYSYNSLVAAE
jgi:N6-adenosine-specific RNA methylase IME4